MHSRSNIAASRHFVLGTPHSYPAQLAYGLRPFRLRKHDSSNCPNKTFESHSPPADRGVIVKLTNHAFLAFVTCVAMFALTGCSDGKQVNEVKALPFELVNSIDLPQNLTVDQALDNRKVCNSVKWSSGQDDQGEIVIEYKCDYKGVDDSMFIKNGTDVESAGDTYQWTYGRDGRPALTTVAAVIHQKDGKSVDIAPGQSANYTIWLAFHDTATNFDQAYSQLTGKRIPVLRTTESTKSISAIPDTTYGNRLAPLFPDQPPQDAAIHAYLQKGMPESVGTYGIDSLGYLSLKDTPESRAALYSVNPADVQIALKVNPYTANESGIGMAALQLQDDKLVCLNELCYDANGHLVGRAPSEVLAKETGGATVGQFGVVTLNAQTQAVTQAPSQQAMQQAAQQDAAAQASSADPLPTGSSDDDWPAMTPCIKKLQDAYVKAAQAHGTDESTSLDQMKEWASTCKALSQ
jgi:hypothetical protein